MSAPSFVICLILIEIATAQEAPVLELPNGRILGRRAVTYANTTYFSFRKIPYATPPVGPLRFKAPQPAQNWTGTLNATTIDVICYLLEENDSTESEDCLFVNVYTPKLPAENDNVSLPVMFWIHGGAFTGGSSVSISPDRFVDSGVILVTINYRIGLFGFLSTQDETIPGNYGLKDQRLALQWTQSNIHLFGGDPTKVTIFGQSAGSASVAYQLLNQDSNGLFRAAIMESGSFLGGWTYQRRARTIAFGTAAEAGFGPSNDSVALLQFLQSLDVRELDAAGERYMAKVQQNLYRFNDFTKGPIYAPVIEVKNPEAFLTKKMYGLLQAGSVLRVPIMIGFNSEEALTFFLDPSQLPPALEAWDADIDRLVPDDMQITDPEEHRQMALRIRDIYTGGEPWSESLLGEGIRYLSDNIFTRSIAKHAELHSSLADTFFYQLSYKGEVTQMKVQFDGAETVGHSEDLSYLFCSGKECSFADFPERDLLNSRRMVKMWTDFAKYQNPTPEPVDLLQNITWPALSVENGDFFYLDINENLEIMNHPKEEVLAAWEVLYDGLNFTDFDTW